MWMEFLQHVMNSWTMPMSAILSGWQETPGVVNELATILLFDLDEFKHGAAWSIISSRVLFFSYSDWPGFRRTRLQNYCKIYLVIALFGINIVMCMPTLTSRCYWYISGDHLCCEEFNLVLWMSKRATKETLRLVHRIWDNSGMCVVNISSFIVRRPSV